ncbi:MAG: hypothetical protein KDD45_12005 [Bdellovibrionales bacterium]|nr:hypothetical protein [Bdellovibrionales bacterium]
MKYFFVVLLWDKLFKNKNYEFVTIRVIENIQRLKDYKEILTSWLEDVPAEYLKVVVKSLQ